MSNITITSAFSDIADAIRAKTGKSDTMTPAEMPTEIASISGGSGGGGGSDEIIRISTVDNTLYNPIQDSDLCTCSITFSKS